MHVKVERHCQGADLGSMQIAIFIIISNWKQSPQSYILQESASVFVIVTSLSSIILLIFKSKILTHFSPVSRFYTPRKPQETKGFLTFSGGIEM